MSTSISRCHVCGEPWSYPSSCSNPVCHVLHVQVRRTLCMYRLFFFFLICFAYCLLDPLSSVVCISSFYNLLFSLCPLVCICLNPFVVCSCRVCTRASMSTNFSLPSSSRTFSLHFCDPVVSAMQFSPERRMFDSLQQRGKGTRKTKVVVARKGDVASAKAANRAGRAGKSREDGGKRDREENRRDVEEFLHHRKPTKWCTRKILFSITAVFLLHTTATHYIIQYA